MSAAVFVAYDATTGQILSKRFAEQAEVEDDFPAPDYGVLPAPDGESDATHYVDVGVPELVELPARPSPDYDFDWATHTWIVGAVLTLAEFKNRKQDALVVARDAKLYGVNLQHHGTAGDGSQDVLVTTSLLERERIRNAAFEAFVVETRAAGSFAARDFRDQLTNLDVAIDGPEAIKLQQTVDAYTEAVWAEYYSVRHDIDVAADFAAAAAALAAASWPDPAA